LSGELRNTDIQLDHDELQLLSFILNKKYDAAAIYEIDDYQEEDPFPIITVIESGVPYDIRTMSLGEISVFTIFWNLHRAQKNSLVLLEEPETFLSPVSQGAFLDYLASICVQKQLTLVLTTHSPQMFSRLSKDQVRFSYRTDVGAALADDSQFDTMRHAVGISSPVDRIILVEDRAAREFVMNVLRKMDHSFLLRSEVIDVGGMGKINSICETFPGGIKSFSMIGLYDGDVRAEVLALKPSWETVFLPGEEPIEVMFQQIIEIDPAFVAARLGRSVGDLEVILAKIRGLDHHDWFEEFVKELHVSYPELMSVCFDYWKSDARNEADVDNFLVDLHRAAVPRTKK
jgi:AAA domain, putative AbiEii toxin, Type IV TA system